MAKDAKLLDYKEKIEKDFLRPLEENEVIKERLYNEKSMRDRTDGEYQRDYTRILYSSSFRRLQNKMQLLAVKSDQFIRNRLTHSLEVAQIARSIATMVGYDSTEIYVVEACSLAHDIGNPPFGHAGERFLNSLSRRFGGFEGNAQTFRILTTVEQKRPEFQGLNLTYRTLLGVLKYYKKFNAKLRGKAFEKQKFIYDDDYKFVKQILQDSGINHRTLDVQIVDLADEIAYAAHDLEDGLRLSLFTVDEVLHGFYASDNKSCIDELEKIFVDSKKKAGYECPYVDSSEYSKLYRKEITSRIINLLLNDIGLVSLSDDDKDKRGTLGDLELGFVDYGKIASGLKKIVYECVTNRDTVYEYENSGKKMMNELYHFYMSKPEYLPPEYRARNQIQQYGLKDIHEEKLQKRLIIDYISGMMDPYVKTAYDRLIKKGE